LIRHLKPALNVTNKLIIDRAAEAARAIALLSFNEANREAMREASCLEHLANLLRANTTDVTLLGNLIWALESLCLNDRNRETLFSNGGIPALVPYMIFQDQQIQSQAVRALRNLSNHVQLSQLFVLSDYGLKYSLEILFSNQNDLVLMQVLELVQNLLLFDGSRRAVNESFTPTILDSLKKTLCNRPFIQPLVLALESLLDH